MGLTYTTWESGPDILDFSVSRSFLKNFLNSLTAVKAQASLPEEPSLALPLLLCQEHGGVTLVHTCSDSGMDQALWLHPAASKLLSICCKLAEPHRVPQPHGPAMSSQALCHHHEWQHFQTSGHKFLALYIWGCSFKRKERADTIAVFWRERLACDRAADCLIACLVQSVPPLSPILKSITAACTSRKSLPVLWVHQDLLLNHLCKYLTCLWRRPVLPRPILVFLIQPFPEELHSFSCSWSAKRHELSSWPWWLLVGGQRRVEPFLFQLLHIIVAMPSIPGLLASHVFEASFW